MMNSYKIYYIENPSRKNLLYIKTMSKNPEEARIKVLQLQLEGKDITIVNIAEVEEHLGNCCLQHKHAVKNIRLAKEKENDHVSHQRKGSLFRGRR